MRHRLVAWAEPWLGHLLATLIFDQPLLSAVGGVLAVVISVLWARKVGLVWWRVAVVGGLCALGGVIGARLGWAIIRYDLIIEKPLLLIDPYGGSISFGALAGAAIAGLLAARSLKVPALRAADIMLPAGIFGIAFSRVGCLLRGCDYGVRSDLPWAVHYPPNSTVFRRHVAQGWVDGEALLSDAVHPFPIYLAVSAVAVFLIGVAFPNLFGKRPGQRALGIFVLWAVGRFVIEFLRYPGNAPMVFGPINLAQLFAAVSGLVVLAVLIVRGGSREDRDEAGTAAADESGSP